MINNLCEKLNYSFNIVIIGSKCHQYYISNSYQLQNLDLFWDWQSDIVKNSFLAGFCKLEMELVQFDMGNYQLKFHFKLVSFQMSQCYLSSKSKTSMKKWYFEYFIADYFPALNKKDPVVENKGRWSKLRKSTWILNIVLYSSMFFSHVATLELAMSICLFIHNAFSTSSSINFLINQLSHQPTLLISSSTLCDF